jgi:hypothetical protein
VLTGSLLALLLLEGALQVLRWTNLVGLDRPPQASSAGKRTVICVGDSHTYGWLVRRGLDPYPEQLEVFLNHGDPEGPFRVENLGIPARNTAMVEQRLHQRLEHSRADLVLVLAGFNNSWNPAQMDAAAGDGGLVWILPRLLRLLLLSSKPPALPAERVILIDGEPFALDASGRKIPINPDPGAREGLRQGRDLQDSIREGLIRIVQRCRDAGVPVLLQTYAAQKNDTFLLANAAARQAAQVMQAGLIDHAAWMERHPEIDPFAAFQEDGHPTRFGYQAMARAVHEYLFESAHFESWPIADPEGPAAVRGSTTPSVVSMTLAQQNSNPEGALTFEVTGAPGQPWQLYLSQKRTEPRQGFELAVDDLFVASAQQIGTSEVFPDTGRDLALVYPLFYRQYAGAQVFAQAVTLDRYSTATEPNITGVSPVIEVQFPAAGDSP